MIGKGVGKRILAFALGIMLAVPAVPAHSVQAEEGQETQMTDLQEAEAEQSGEMAGTEPKETDVQAAPVLQYVYVDKSYVALPGIQEILVSFTDGTVLEQAVLICENEATGEIYTTEAVKYQDSAVLFQMNYTEEAQTGTYRLREVQLVSEGQEYTYVFQECGIESRYGVNEECITNPDAVVEEEEDSEQPVSFVTMDNEGNLTESDTVQEAMGEAAAELQAEETSSARTVTTGETENAVVVLDPGHGGTDSGAVGNGASEKDLTLKIAKYCKEALERCGGIEVYMTRETDTAVGGSDVAADLKARVDFAASKNADLFVSIHLNSFGKETANGAEVYYPNSNYNATVGSEGKAAAQSIQDELVALGLKNRGIKIRDSESGSTYPDGSLQDYYALIWRCKRAGFPGIIVEHAFIDNASDYEKYLSSDEKLKKLGEADAAGIMKYFGLKIGGWKQDSTGWRYQNEDGTYVKNQWKQIDGDGAWYHFDASGYMNTGFYEENGKSYYLGTNGKMVTKWKYINGFWYYFGTDGVMIKGQWLLLEDVWYYLESDGRMVTGWKTINGYRYYFDENGEMYSGTCTINGVTYHFRSQGGIRIGWSLTGGYWYYTKEDLTKAVGFCEIGEKTYYFDTYGRMQTDWVLVSGTWYYFDEDGAMVTGWIKLKGCWYYLQADGKMAVGFQKIEGHTYYFKSNGAMKTGWVKSGNNWYYFRSSGAMCTGWIRLNGIWYYLEADGKMATGWKTIDGKNYYLGEDGAMYTGTHVIDGDTYQFDTSGACLNKKTSGWVTENGNKYYVVNDTKITGWKSIDGTWYYFDPDTAVMQTGWIKVKEVWYYLDDTGAMQKGWLTDGGYQYYLNTASNSYGAEGAMLRGYCEIDGTWYYFNKGKSPEGALTYTGVTKIMGSSELGSDKDTVVGKMVTMYKNRGATYPAEVMKAGGAADITAFCEILYEEAVLEGVKPEIVFGQAMKETGYLQYGGDVKVEQYNFAGLGASGGGASGATFPDVRTGLRAQVQHLKAYASDENLKNECVDPRFKYVVRNTAPYVEWLGIQENPNGKGWAVDINYGIALMNLYVKPMYML